jgi:hypothetical protein
VPEDALLEVDDEDRAYPATLAAALDVLQDAAPPALLKELAEHGELPEE